MDDIEHGDVDKIHSTSCALTGACNYTEASHPAGNNSKDSVKEDSNSKKSTLEVCEVCGKPSSLLCGKCRATYYCCKAHQKDAWKQHKSKCYPVQRTQIGTEDAEPKELVVTRDIAQGEVFLKESPIMIYPRSSYFPIVCVECCRPILGENKIVRCAECGLELCSKACQAGAEYHKRYECSIFQKWKGKDLDLANSLHQKKVDKYFAIGLIRTLLLREIKPKLWERIQKMNSFCKQRESETNHEAVLKAYTSLVHEDFNLTNYDEDTINHVLGVLSANSIDIPEDFTSNLRPPVYKHASILFPLCSEAGRSCVPNARFSIKGRYEGNFQLSVTASVAIPEGSPVSFSTEQGLAGTFRRRAMKQNKFYRTCHCDRCKDPTELGTFLSALKCKRCTDVKSYCLQTNPLEENSQWKCTNCGGTLEYREVVCIVDEISGEIQPSSLTPCTMETVEHVQDLIRRIKKVKQESLHPNHFVIINVELDICKLLVHTTTEVVKGKNSLLLGLAEHILSVADIIAPGHSFLRGHAMHFRLCAIVSKIMVCQTYEHDKYLWTKGSEAEKMGCLKKFEEYLQEYKPIFETEPDDSGEYLMLKELEMKKGYITELDIDVKATSGKTKQKRKKEHKHELFGLK